MADTILVDSHCHLDLEQFDSDREAVIARARDAGICLIVNPGIDLFHSRRAIALAEEYPEVYAAVGIHPNSSDEFDAAVRDELCKMSVHPKVVAIGEIGLDYHWGRVTPDQQKVAFQAQLDLAAELGLPVIIHNRKADNDIAALLRTWVQSKAFRASPLASRPFAGVLHAFGGDLSLACEAYTWKFVLSLGGPATFKNARSLHAIIPDLRRDRLMLETDAPYLTPHPHRGARNEPAYVTLIGEQISNLFGVSQEELWATSTALALRFFGLEETYGTGDSFRHQPARA